MGLLAYVSIRNVHKKKAWSLYISFQNYNKQKDTGKFIYNPLILDNIQLLSNMIDCKTAQMFAKIFYLTIQLFLIRALEWY